MNLKPFKLERYFAHDEFAVRHILSASDCDGPSMAELVESADAETRALWDSLRLGYTETMGHPLLRAEIASLHQSLTPDDVLVLTPEEGIFLTMNALLGRGDHVVCTYPAYQSLYEIARALGCRIDFWKAHPAPDGWRFEVDDFASLMRPDTRLVITNFPHNPTGALLAESAWNRVLTLAADAGAYVFSDEMYRLLELHGRAPLCSAPDAYERAISLSGMSKTFGLPGLRIGWLATRDRHLLATIEELRDYTTICSSAPSEVLALMGLRMRNRLIPSLRARIERHLDVLEAFCASRSGEYSVFPPRAGTVCLLGLHKGSAEDLCRKARAADLLALPATVLDFGDAHIRVGLGRSGFPKALAVFATIHPGALSQVTGTSP